MSDQRPALSLKNVSKTFQSGDQGQLQVLVDISLDLQPGRLVGLVGASGSGKSTLLSLMALLDDPSEGTVEVAGQATKALSQNQKTALRSQHVGFVYQFHNLLPDFTALENVILPQRLAGTALSGAKEQAHHLLDKLGVGPRADHRPHALSGGEQQRVAIARAMANKPSVILADEPTGNLDPGTAEKVFTELRHYCQQHQIAALVATHNYDLARQLDQVYELKAGRLAPWALLSVG